MDFFFYGTLIDRAVLERVLGHPVAPSRLREAVIPDHTRVRVEGSPYATLVQKPGESVAGVILRMVGREERIRLDRYEGALYEAKRATAIVEGRTVPVMIYAVRPPARPTAEPWSPSEPSRPSGRYRP
jgi:hypothetical protein